MSVVFLSYDRNSRPFAEALAQDIQALGHTIWFDKDLTGGQRWWDTILENIRGCHVFVPLLTPRSIESMACQRELSYAIALHKLILPVLAAQGVSLNLVPLPIASLQFVDYRTRDRDAALNLARALAILPSPAPLPDPLPSPPEIPSSYLGELAQRLASPSLSYEQQSTLVLELKRSLKDQESAEDGRVLLRQFRNRRDLFASIAQDIDELLISEKGSTSSRVTVESARTEPRESVAQNSKVGTAGRAWPLIPLAIGLAVIAVTMLALWPRDRREPASDSPTTSSSSNVTPTEAKSQQNAVERPGAVQSAPAEVKKKVQRSADAVPNIQSKPFVAPSGQNLGECTFERNPSNPSYVDGACKDVLDKLALQLQARPEGRLIVWGYIAPGESSTLPAKRAENVKSYLVQGGSTRVDPSRVQIRDGGTKSRSVSFYFVPS